VTPRLSIATGIIAFLTGYLLGLRPDGDSLLSLTLMVSGGASIGYGLGWIARGEDDWSDD
jgi:hypothetical protein